MTIESKLMRLQAWTPFFTPKEDTPTVQVWILLAGLPWHCFKKPKLVPLLENIGNVLYLDTTSITRTREGVANEKIQIDLTKPRPRHVWIGLDNEDDIVGIWQPVDIKISHLIVSIAEIKDMI